LSFFFHFPSFYGYEEDTRFNRSKKVKRILHCILPCSSSNELAEKFSNLDNEDFTCANQVRSVIDRIEPSSLRKSISSVWYSIQRSAFYPSLYTYVGTGTSMINLGLVTTIDGTEVRSSKRVSCSNCCVRRYNKGTDREIVENYHQCLIAVVVPPNSNYVLPIDVESIEKQDGNEKNDCERNANKRLLPRLASNHRNVPMTILGDDLNNNTPTLKILMKYGRNWIMTCKPDSHKTAYDAFVAASTLGNCHSYTAASYNYIPGGQKTQAQQCKSIFTWVDKVPSKDNEGGPESNSVDYTLVVEKIVSMSTETVILERGFSTNLKVTAANVWNIRNVWRKTWKLENNANNTLKNQGINLGHNYGHGKKHLVTNTIILSLLVLLITNILLLVNEDHFCRWRSRWKTLIKAVEMLKEIFHWKGNLISSWEELWTQLFLDSS
jgi:hypothetical protein